MKQRITNIPLKILKQGIPVFYKFEDVTYKGQLVDVYEELCMVEVVDAVMRHSGSINKNVLYPGDMFSCKYAELWTLDSLPERITHDSLWDKFKKLIGRK